MSDKNDPGSQRYEAAVPVGQLHPHPDNPRIGNVDTIQKSMNENGFFGAVMAQEGTGTIIAGRHTWQAAVDNGDTTIPVIWLDVDDERALRILLADNAASDDSSYDDEVMARVLASLAQTDDGLAGTLHDDDGIDWSKLADPLDDVAPTERAEIRRFDQVHMLLSFPPHLLGDVQAAIAGLDQAVTARSSVN